MEVKLVRFKFKNNGMTIWRDWSAELKRREVEVLQTLKDEGVLLEACFYSPSDFSVFYFMAAEDFEKVNRIARDSVHPIDKEHRAKREAGLEFVEQLECLFSFKE